MLEIGCIWGSVKLPWQPKCCCEYNGLYAEMLLEHQLSTSSSNLLLQTSEAFKKFSGSGKCITVSNHLNIYKTIV